MTQGFRSTFIAASEKGSLTLQAEHDSATGSTVIDASATDESTLTQVDADKPEAGTPPIDEFVEVLIEGESPPPEEDESQAPEWVRGLRKKQKELV